MKRTIFLIPFLFLLMSQSNQRQLGVITAVENFFESPFEEFANARARSKYKKVAAETLAQESSAVASRIVQCDLNGAPLPASALNDLLNIPHTTCKCEPWGTCLKDACSCGILCPDNFHIFRRNGMTSVRSLTNPQDGLAFRNFFDPEPVEGRIRSTDGVCWGHAALTQRFNRLGFFRPEVRPPYRIYSTDPEERKKAIKFYKKIIDDVVNNKATEIPGYANLQAFSGDPEFSNYFHDKVTREWADRAMSWQGLRVAVASEPRTRTHNEIIFAEVKKRLSLNQQPNLIFTEKGRRFETHASLVSHEETKNGKQVLCMRDNNYLEADNAACISYMYINEQGQMVNVFRQKEQIVGAVELAFNDERDALKQMKSLRKKCAADKGCQR